MNKRVIEVNKNEVSKSFHSHNRKAGRKGRRHRKMPESEMLRRKGRMVGSDDLNAVVNSLKYAEHEGFNGAALQVAHNAAVGLKAAVNYSTRNQHKDAAVAAGAALYAIRRNERVSGLKVQCRDGERRSVKKVVEWFSGVHGRIASEIEAALEKEAKRASRNEAANEGALGVELEATEVLEAKTA